MAEQCCYYEALRKQRILDRAYEAKCRMLSAQEKVGLIDKQNYNIYGMVCILFTSSILRLHVLDLHVAGSGCFSNR